MEPEGSLPHSQVPATCPYPVPARSSPHPHILLPDDPYYYYHPIYVCVSQVVSRKETLLHFKFQVNFIGSLTAVRVIKIYTEHD